MRTWKSFQLILFFNCDSRMEGERRYVTTIILMLAKWFFSYTEKDRSIPVWEAFSAFLAAAQQCSLRLHHSAIHEVSTWWSETSAKHTASFHLSILLITEQPQTQEIVKHQGNKWRFCRELWDKIITSFWEEGDKPDMKYWGRKYGISDILIQVRDWAHSVGFKD